MFYKMSTTTQSIVMSSTQDKKFVRNVFTEMDQMKKDNDQINNLLQSLQTQTEKMDSCLEEHKKDIKNMIKELQDDIKSIQYMIQQNETIRHEYWSLLFFLLKSISFCLLTLTSPLNLVFIDASFYQAKKWIKEMVNKVKD